MKQSTSILGILILIGFLAPAIALVNNGSGVINSPSANNIGVGVESPSAKLEIKSESANILSLTRNGSLNATLAYNNDVNSFYSGVDENGAFAIGTSSNLALENDFYIDNGTGFIGLGTREPDSPLHISSDSPVTALFERTTGGTHQSIVFVDGANERATWSASTTAAFQVYTGTHFHGNESASLLFRILPDGNVGIGDSSPDYTLEVVGTAGKSTGTSWTNTSDIRLKDVQGNYEHGLEEISKLQPIVYSYKEGNPLGLPSDLQKVGFSAQEVQKYIPEAVIERKDGYLELNVDPIHWAVVNAFKELKAENNALKTQLEKLKSDQKALQNSLCSDYPSLCS